MKAGPMGLDPAAHQQQRYGARDDAPAAGPSATTSRSRPAGPAHSRSATARSGARASTGPDRRCRASGSASCAVRQSVPARSSPGPRHLVEADERPRRRVAQQRQSSRYRPVADAAGRDEHRPAQLERVRGGDQCAARARRFDDDRGVRERGDDPVAPRVCALLAACRMVLADHRAAACDDLVAQPCVGTRPGWWCPPPITPTVPRLLDGGGVRRASMPTARPDTTVARPRPAAWRRCRQCRGRPASAGAYRRPPPHAAGERAGRPGLDHRGGTADRVAAGDSPRLAASMSTARDHGSRLAGSAVAGCAAQLVPGSCRKWRPPKSRLRSTNQGRGGRRALPRTCSVRRQTSRAAARTFPRRCRGPRQARSTRLVARHAAIWPSVGWPGSRSTPAASTSASSTTARPSRSAIVRATRNSRCTGSGGQVPVSGHLAERPVRSGRQCTCALHR